MKKHDIPIIVYSTLAILSLIGIILTVMFVK